MNHSGRGAHTDERGVPDLEAAKRVPIGEVIDLLGLERQGQMVRCWRPDHHQHGDRTPSASVWHRKNKVRCHVCDARALSTVDLVMSVLGLDTYHALLWLDQHFQLPSVLKGKHLVERVHAGSFGRVGVTANRLEPLIRSGLFAAMSHAEVRLLTVLDAFAGHEAESCSISYAGLRRYSGLRKDSTVAKAVRCLANMHAITVTKGRGGHGLNTCNRYTLTLEDSRFLALLSDCHKQTREEIEAQRQLRAERRARLSSLHRFTPTVHGSKGGTPKYLPVTDCLPLKGEACNLPHPFSGSGKFDKRSCEA